MERIANGNNTTAAIKILKEATCGGEKMASPFSLNIPFFISMKELPQITANKSSKPQLFNSLIIRQI